MGFKRVEKNRRSPDAISPEGTGQSVARHGSAGKDFKQIESRRACPELVERGRHNGEFSRRLFCPCHRTSHAKCPSAGNSKHFTDATQICYLIAYVLIAIIKTELQRDASLHTCLQILSVFIFEKTQIHAPCSKLSQPTRTATLTS